MSSVSILFDDERGLVGYWMTAVFGIAGFNHHLFVFNPPPVALAESPYPPHKRDRTQAGRPTRAPSFSCVRYRAIGGSGPYFPSGLLSNPFSAKRAATSSI